MTIKEMQNDYQRDVEPTIKRCLTNYFKEIQNDYKEMQNDYQRHAE